jgi:molybdopterin adenylyltransferase
MIRVGLLTVSDEVTKGQAGDKTGEAIRDVLPKGQYEIAGYEIVPRESAQIKRVLRLWTDREGFDLIITSGGIHLSIKDHVPEVTRELVEKDLPGLPEIMRVGMFKKFPNEVFSRGRAGVRASSLIVNVSGDLEVAAYSVRIILPVIAPIVATLTGRPVTNLNQATIA